MKEETERLEMSNKQLQERFAVAQERYSVAQNETTKLLREKKNLLEQLATLQVKLDNASESTVAESKDHAAMLTKVERLEEELGMAQQENTKRVAETTQFQQMKKLMQNQAARIRELQARLNRYEPEDDEVRDDDDE